MQQNLADYVLQTPDTLIFPLVRQELELLYDNPVAFSSYIKVWYDGEDFKGELNKSYQKQYNLLKANEQDWLWYTYWVIVSINDRSIIGSINFKGVPQQDICEIGYGINKKYQNQGFGTKAVMLIAEWAKSMGVKHIVAKTDRHNAASQKVLTKNNFVLNKTTKNYHHYQKTL